MIRKLYIFVGLIAVLASPALADTLARPPATQRIVVLTRDIARGEVIADGDLTFTPAPGVMTSSTITNMDAARGMEARRPLRAGEAIQASDLRHPIVVTRGQTITMIFNAPGVDLTAMGRAMSEGGVGDTVTVQNPTSFRMLSGVVTGPGTVRAAGPIANGSAMNISTQFTARQ